MRDAIDEIDGRLRELQWALVASAERDRDLVLPDYTHLQRAQPVLLSHHLLAYAWMLHRDVGRFRDAFARTDVLPLGAAALAGTSYPIDPRLVADLLGFSRIAENSLDATSDRDFAVEFVSAASLLMTHLSRLAAEIVLWTTAEFGFVELLDTISTGSSIMPQKKNPDAAELIRGKAGRVLGDLVTLLAVLRGLPLAYNSDLQEDKEAVFDAVDTATASLQVMGVILHGVRVNVGGSGHWLVVHDVLHLHVAELLGERRLHDRAARRLAEEQAQHDVPQRPQRLEGDDLEEAAADQQDREALAEPGGDLRRAQPVAGDAPGDCPRDPPPVHRERRDQVEHEHERVDAGQPAQQHECRRDA